MHVEPNRLNTMTTDLDDVSWGVRRGSPQRCLRHLFPFRHLTHPSCPPNRKWGLSTHLSLSQEDGDCLGRLVLLLVPHPFAGRETHP